jgi:hypothetical protein
MKNNFMFDVAFTVEGPWELPEDVPAIQLITGLQKRIADLTLSYANKSEDITEAFGYCDSYKVDESPETKLV